MDTTTPDRKRSRRKPKPAPPPPPTPEVDARRRLFLAVPLSPEVTSFVDATISTLTAEGWPIRWTAPGNAHITVQFLGAVEPEVAGLLRLSLPAVVKQHQGFSLRTANLGVFPTMKRPRVLWLGLYGPAHRLETLRSSIVEHLATLDLDHDDGEFHPHITLGRVRDTPGTRVRDLPAAIRQRFEQAEASGEVTAKSPLPVPVHEIHLMESHLGPQGPTYDIVARFPLADPDS